MNGEIMAAGPPTPEAVTAELERILESAAFRNARRSQEFLRYVVLNALAGRYDELKERSIGATVFQRPPDYDTGDDSIVRVKASELRKRLAQYYMEAGPEHEVRIELPAGSYVPEFHRAAPAVPVAGKAKTPQRRKGAKVVWAMAAMGAAVAACAVFLYVRRPGLTALDQFWQPVFASEKPVLLCVAHPVVYAVTGRTQELLQADPNARPAAVPFADLVRDPDHYVGIGDAFALGQLAGFLRGRQKDVKIRMGNDVSFADLRSSPAVLIGAFTNQWTMPMTSNLRYVFERAPGSWAIKDQMSGQRWQRDAAPNPASDYVLLSRIFDSRTGDIVITAAGLAHAGTQMAGEFLTNPAYLRQALKDAPADWPRRNVQLVLAGEVIGKTAGPPRVAASWYW